jgi:hypothetical protein
MINLSAVLLFWSIAALVYAAIIAYRKIEARIEDKKNQELRAAQHFYEKGRSSAINIEAESEYEFNQNVIRYGSPDSERAEDAMAMVHDVARWAYHIQMEKIQAEVPIGTHCVHIEINLKVHDMRQQPEG